MTLYTTTLQPLPDSETLQINAVRVLGWPIVEHGEDSPTTFLKTEVEADLWLRDLQFQSNWCVKYNRKWRARAQPHDQSHDGAYDRENHDNDEDGEFRTFWSTWL